MKTDFDKYIEFLRRDIENWKNLKWYALNCGVTNVSYTLSSDQTTYKWKLPDDFDSFNNFESTLNERLEFTIRTGQISPSVNLPYYLFPEFKYIINKPTLWQRVKNYFGI